MWDFLSVHPWWGLTYLIIVCLTAIFVAAVLTGTKRGVAHEYVPRHTKRDDDVVH